MAQGYSAAQDQLKAAETRLQELRGLAGERNEYVGGYGGGHLHTSSHAQTLLMEKERRELAAEVARLKEEVAKELKEFKKTAKASGDVANWTARLLDGEKHFAAGVDALDSALVARTRGLVSREDWAKERDKLQEEMAREGDRVRLEEEAARVKAEGKKAKMKRKRHQAEQSRLSFADDGEEDGDGAGSGPDDGHAALMGALQVDGGSGLIAPAL
ncbi:hypothetical protein T492DRAFT_1025914 [Pavlovales sp. CCMP2436]|nr:hypothetical protein T492DRAFT_1025914 [Pavlovales sp. CCMP2436]|mmetsp:Transcript_1821/g.4798  ORF Transcript_1821/g.4798 Transcript_1821/m.4798 type:complete len:215 (+) Transcript_1821:104-748(+)